MVRNVTLPCVCVCFPEDLGSTWQFPWTLLAAGWRSFVSVLCVRFPDGTKPRPGDSRPNCLPPNPSPHPQLGSAFSAAPYRARRVRSEPGLWLGKGMGVTFQLRCFHLQLLWSFIEFLCFSTLRLHFHLFLHLLSNTFFHKWMYRLP